MLFEHIITIKFTIIDVAHQYLQVLAPTKKIQF